MTDLLSTLGALTLGGSAAVGLLALASRSARARYGAKWRCLAWLLLCLRLAVPVSLLPQGEEQVQSPVRLPAPSDTVIYHAPAPQAPGGGSQTGVEQTAPTLPSQTAPPGDAASQPDSEAPVEQDQGGFSLSLSQALLGVWLAGAAGMALWILLSHLRFLRYLRRWAKPVEDPETVQRYNQAGDLLKLDRRPRLLLCPGLAAPMLAGLFRPVLLLPEGEPEPEALRCALLHELTHFCRRDIWLKALALWVNIVHWFNPVMWYMVRLVERDTELACDEGVLRLLPPEEHAAYGRTILDAVDRLRRQHT